MEETKTTRKPWTRNRVIEELLLTHPTLKLEKTPDGVFSGKESNIEVICSECGKASKKSAESLFKKGYGCTCQSKLFIVYKTTNLVNGKYYIGVHCLKGKDDQYIGCGISKPSDSVIVAKRNKNSPFADAVNKYGFDSFKRETLYRFATKKDAYAKEAEIVTAKLLKDPNCYNAAIGGLGGAVCHPDVLSTAAKRWRDERNLAVAKMCGFSSVAEQQEYINKEINLLKEEAKELRRKASIVDERVKETRDYYAQMIARKRSMLAKPKYDVNNIRIRRVEDGFIYESIRSFYVAHANSKAPLDQAGKSGYLFVRKLKEKGRVIKFGVEVELVEDQAVRGGVG